MRSLMLLFVLSACGGEYRVAVSFDDPALRDEAVRVEVAIIESCSRVALGATPPALARVEFAVGELARPLGDIEPGTYALYARVSNADCDVIAAGCTDDVELNAGGDDALRVEVGAASGAFCEASSACIAGTCVIGADAGTRDAPACPPGEAFCGGACIDVTSDEMNCGDCANACDFANASGSCVGGMCTVELCESRFGDCDMNGDNGCEVSLAEPATCGACGVACEDPAPLCDATMDEVACTSSCGASTQCGGSCVNTQTDRLHCGMCDNTCDLANATPECNAGSCTIVECSEGFGDCDGDPSNGCEVDLSSDTANCGVCGMECDASEACAASRCDGYVEVSVGEHHVCALRTQGGVDCWGANDAGQSDPNAVGSSIERPTRVRNADGTEFLARAVAVGGRHTCFIDLLGLLHCMGDNSRSQIGGDVVAGVSVHPVLSDVGRFDTQTFTSLTAGDEHGCAIDLIGDVWCWGSGEFGQIGRAGADSNRALDVDLGGIGAEQVAASRESTCALLGNQQVHCFGRSSFRQLGRVGGSDPGPVTLSSSAALSGVDMIVAGRDEYCAIAGGVLSCWGRNGDAEIRVPATTVTFPTEVASASAVTDAFLLDGTLCRTTTRGTRCSGRQSDGQVGGVPAPARVTDVPVASLAAFTRVRAGRYTACGFDVTGALSCWGASFEGTIPRDSLTVEIPEDAVGADGTPLSDVSAVSLSSNGGCAIDGSGRANCWGDGRLGALGQGDAVSSPVPLVVEPLGTAVDVARGEMGSSVIADTGGSDELYFFGDDTGDALAGVGSAFVPTLLDVPVPSAVVLSGDHGCARTMAFGATGAILCWGNNDRMQTGSDGSAPAPVLGAGGTRFTAAAVVVGDGFSCANLPSGKVSCWGDNSRGQLARDTSGRPGGVDDIVGVEPPFLQIVAGRNHVCGIHTTENGLWCWGGNESGQIGDGRVQVSSPPVRVGPPSVGSVSAGADFTCATDLSTGAVQCWGGNTRHQLGNGTVEMSVRPVDVPGLVDVVDLQSAPLGHGTCARSAAGTLKCWGADDFHALAVGNDMFFPPTLIAP